MGQSYFAIRLAEDDPQALRIERHGYVNLINVVHAELQLIERMLDAPGALRQTVFLAERAARAFRERAFIDGHESALSRFRTIVREAVSSARDQYDPQNTNRDVTEAIGILDSVLADAGCRVHEVLARHSILRPVEIHEGQELPMGLGYVLERLLTALQLHSDPNEDPYVKIHGNTVLAGVVESASSAGSLKTLTEGLPPSVLHDRIEAGESLLRPCMELFYFTVPGGSAVLNSDGPTVTIEAELGTTVTADA